MLKKTTAPKPEPEPLTLYDVNVSGPSVLELSGKASQSEVVRWWDRAQQYADAMRDLGRVTMLCRIEDEDLWYLASVPREVKRLTEGGTA